MYNLRYHIASLVSVFLALALGLVLGGLIVQRGTFDGGAEGLIEGLREEFASLREENGELTEQNEQLDAFTGDFVDYWTAERLDGRTVVVLTNAGREDGLQAATQAIEGAGGSVAIVTMAVPGFGLANEEKRADVEALAAEGTDPQASIVASLAAEWTTADEGRPLTDALIELGVVNVDGLEDDVAAEGLVVIAAPDGVSDEAAIALARQFVELEVVAVGAQAQATDTGVASAASAAGVSALDTLGSDIGRYTLVSLLAGGEPGYYGTASGAAALYPSFPQPQESGPPL